MLDRDGRTYRHLLTTNTGHHAGFNLSNGYGESAVYVWLYAVMC